jgi:hypothetical protein
MCSAKANHELIHDGRKGCRTLFKHPTPSQESTDITDQMPLLEPNLDHASTRLLKVGLDPIAFAAADYPHGGLHSSKARVG